MAKKIIEPINEEVVARRAYLDKLIRKRKTLVQENAELEALYNYSQAELMQQFTNKTDKLNSEMGSLDLEIRAVFEQLPQKETLTLRKVEGLAGIVKVKKAYREAAALDREKLLQWAKENNKNELINIKIKEDFRWAEFKVNLEVTELADGLHIIDTSTGEMIELEGLGIVETPEKLIVE